MLEVVQFIFSNFWTWLGTVIIVGVFGEAVSHTISNLRGRK